MKLKIKKIGSIYNQKKAFWSVFSVLIVLLALYLGMVGGTIYNTAIRSNAAKDVAFLTNRVSELEYNYLTLQNRIGADFVKDQGFVEVLNPRFVTFGINPKALSVNKTR